MAVSHDDKLLSDESFPSSNQPHYNWMEVTQDFLSGCKDLELGELLHDDLFGLFEAMSAIEMMDPKMDAGMAKAGGGAGNSSSSSATTKRKNSPMSLNDAISDNSLPWENISIPEFVTVFDHTLSCLVTWFEGHSLAQTVLTNLYLHCGDSPELRPPHPELKAYVVATLKLVDLIKDIIAKATVFEEEDFQPLSYGFLLASDVSEAKAMSSLKEAEDATQKLVRASKSNTESQEYLEATAMYSRLKFYRHFFQALLFLTKQDLPNGLRHISCAKEQISTMSETINIGVETKDGENVLGFEPMINQRLLPPTFPRYTEIRGREATFVYLSELLERLVNATNVAHLTTYLGAVEFFMEFGRNSPCVLSRSISQLLYSPLHASPQNQPKRISGPLPGFQDLLKDACKSFIAPLALTMKYPPYNSPQVKDGVETFFSQWCRPMGLIIQTFGHNSARQRDKIPTLLEELAIAQEEADKLDTMLSTLPANTDGNNTAPVLYFSTWLLYYVLRLMIRYILSGFELELFSAHEYPYLYWYLYELLFPWLTTCLHKADSHLIEYEHYAENQTKSQGKSKKKPKNSNKNKKPRPYAKEITHCQAFSTLCSGYFKLMVALKKQNKIIVPDSCFDNECVRYNHRFAPFNTLLTPPSMPFSQYWEVYQLTANSEPNMLYIGAARDFGRARQLFESVSSIGTPLQDYEVLVSITKKNLVASSVLAKDSSRKIDFDFESHKTFPVIKLVS